MDDGFVCRLRGLPWSATSEEIVDFFGDSVGIVGGAEGVHFTFSREGRPSGEAFIELESEEDCENAVTKHNEHMGSRYIEVFRSKKSEMDWVVKRAGRNQPQAPFDAVVRLRGLPFGCSKEEIAQFFTGMEIVPNGIMLPEDRTGRSTGEAYVQFASPDIAERALTKHKERIGHRYIEIFKSTLNEASVAMDVGMSKPRPLMSGMNRPSPYNRSERFGMGMGTGMRRGMGSMGQSGRNLKGFYDDDDDYGFGGGSMMNQMGGMGSMSGGMMNRRGNMRQQQRMGGRMSGGGSGSSSGGMGMMRDRFAQPGSHYVSKTGHSVHLRGLPFQALDSDISDFFTPLVPVRVEFEFNPMDGRPTGEANVDFSTHQEAVEAMKKHKTNMQHRYIELFLNSTPAGRSDGGMGMSSGGNSSFGNNSMNDGFDSFDNDSGMMGNSQMGMMGKAASAQLMGGGDGNMDGGMMGNMGGMGRMGGSMGGSMGGGMSGGMGSSGMGGRMGGMGSNYTAF